MDILNLVSTCFGYLSTLQFSALEPHPIPESLDPREHTAPHENSEVSVILPQNEPDHKVQRGFVLDAVEK